MPKKVSQAEFIKRCTNIHNGKYDYSESVYIGMRSKITVICPIHGKFEKSAKTHIRGSGCPECLSSELVVRNQITYRPFMTHAEFIKKARKIHGNLYNYPDEYVQSNIKLRICCPIHGDFTILPKDHISKEANGCPNCGRQAGYMRRSINQKSGITAKPIRNTDDFINQATITHKGKYDYSKAVYYNSTTAVTITCPIHGDFAQRAGNHAYGSGCPKCSPKGVLCSHEDFVKKARLVHGDKYDYPDEYKGALTAINVLCPTHGTFKVFPTNHLYGDKMGCKQCRKDSKNFNDT